jgi:hypothetical protein
MLVNVVESDPGDRFRHVPPHRDQVGVRQARLGLWFHVVALWLNRRMSEANCAGQFVRDG